MTTVPLVHPALDPELLLQQANELMSSGNKHLCHSFLFLSIESVVHIPILENKQWIVNSIYFINLSDLSTPRSELEEGFRTVADVFPTHAKKNGHTGGTGSNPAERTNGSTTCL